MGKTSQRSFLVKVAGVDGYYATKDGGESTAEVGKVWDGGELKPDLLGGPNDVQELTVGRPYDPVRDQPVIDRLEPLVGRWRTTVSVQPTDADLVPVGKPSVYDAMLSSVNPPEVDAASSDPSTYELVFQPA